MLILVLLKDFISNISKPQILLTRSGTIFLNGLNFQRQIFFNGTKEAGCPTLVRLLLKHQGIYVGYIREMLYSHVTDKTIDVSQWPSPDNQTNLSCWRYRRQLFGDWRSSSASVEMWISWSFVGEWSPEDFEKLAARLYFDGHYDARDGRDWNDETH